MVIRQGTRRWLQWGALLFIATLSACDGRSAQAREPLPGRSHAADTAFANLITRLSEPGASFDTDNLISNEASYLHVMGRMREMGVSGGAYIGVGPDQSFSYIAQTRPEIAYIIDIRRDNLLQHLLFKALFALAETRIEYVSLLFGRPAPDHPDAWTEQDAAALIGYMVDTPAEPEASAATWRAIEFTVMRLGVRLSEEDLEMIRFIHGSFVNGGVNLRFTSHNRGPQWYYPTFAELVLEHDLEGMRSNYLSSEDDYRFLRRMQAEDRIVPVVGDLAGEHALAAVGDDIARRGLVVSVFYTSNVEFYLMQDRTFGRFAATAAALPRDEKSVIIRSLFRSSHPQAVPGYVSTQLLQTLDRFASEHRSGGLRTYRDVVLKGALELKTEAGVP